MSNVSPIRGLRPRPELVSQVVAPPYDVLDSDEARALAEGNDLTWLHVSKPEIDLDPAIDLYDERVYAKALENYLALLERGVLLREERPAYYVYRLSIGGRSQTGILAGAAVEEYEKELIKKHELTRADKETDRTRHTRTLDAHTGPVFLVYRKSPAIDALVAALVATPPVYDVTTHDGVRNELWVATETDALRRAFADLPCLYIADGHHRAASYSRCGAEKRSANPAHRGDERYNHFLSVIFPHDQLRIMPYNRVVEDLNSLTEEAFLVKVRERFTVSESASASPDRRHRLAMYLGGRWLGLEPLPGSFEASDPVKSLDVSILQDNLLAPILGINDPRRDHRIDFVGGIRGTEELERRVKECSGPSVAFSMFPTSVEELMAISDAGRIMPPKSTWFEPKLKDGFVIHELTERPLGAPRP